MRHISAALLAGLFTLGAHAGVYTYIDNEGNRVFTDQPQSEHAERIELAPSNGMPAGKIQPPEAVPEAIPRELGYQVLRILIPEPDATIRDMAGNLIITATSEPGLHPGHGFRLIMDGKPMGTPGASPVFSLENIDRGTHQISVEIVDPQGRIVERTPAQPFHMKRISLAEKRRANPCQKKDWGVRPECPIEDKPKDPPKDIPLVPFI
ncbi:DUF4124 domain-containing protein [Aquipseudomonas alcaligenes]|jgi:hypothetical protein|uniref:DUF4124 domain-containing protein n=1 Tax=Aquipseudomonas alcaligenes TaxID=43263 RepID=A0A1N6UM83_AQUAC|nr:DUF4124 domain-containing protein [Pseudomonas alcaligenes]SIQ66755.1 protein of unknown function [Pseudomonas alcaligenes]